MENTPVLACGAEHDELTLVGELLPVGTSSTVRWPNASRAAIKRTLDRAIAHHASGQPLIPATWWPMPGGDDEQVIAATVTTAMTAPDVPIVIIGGGEGRLLMTPDEARHLSLLLAQTLGTISAMPGEIINLATRLAAPRQR